MWAPILSAVLACLGAIGLLASAVMGVGPAADYVLDAAEASFAVAAVVFLAYVIVGIIADARALGAR